MTRPDGRPSVLFVCVKNGGKSQMAAGLMAKVAGNAVDVYSAGTRPGAAVNALSAQVLAEVDVDITGREAHVDQVAGTRFENWNTVEPSEPGIEGVERMRLVRDDIAYRVDVLLGRLLR